MTAPDRAAIGLTVTDGTGAMHARAWRIPPELAGLFAAQMTARFGVPDEMISTEEAMEAGRQRSAAEGDAVFLTGGTAL